MNNRFVYLMRCNTFYKIGISIQVHYRTLEPRLEILFERL